MNSPNNLVFHNGRLYFTAHNFIYSDEIYYFQLFDAENISGQVYYDINENGEKDPNEKGIYNLPIVASGDDEIIKAEIEILTEDLDPSATNGDPTGQEANLNTLIDRINEKICSEASLSCYACLESFPPLSIIDLKVTLNGSEVEKTMHLVTHEDAPLEFRSIN